MFLTSPMYYPPGSAFRISPKDLDQHVSWMKSINSRLPAGSNYTIEIGHNGNGNIGVCPCCVSACTTSTLSTMTSPRLTSTTTISVPTISDSDSSSSTSRSRSTRTRTRDGTTTTTTITLDNVVNAAVFAFPSSPNSRDWYIEYADWYIASYFISELLRCRCLHDSHPPPMRRWSNHLPQPARPNEPRIRQANRRRYRPVAIYCIVLPLFDLLRAARCVGKLVDNSSKSRCVLPRLSYIYS